MLRIVVIAVGATLMCAGIGLLARGVHIPGWQCLVGGGLILVGTAFERWRYRRIERLPPGPWQQTGERFLDPSSGDPVEVMFDPRTGERRYVSGTTPDAKNPPV